MRDARERGIINKTAMTITHGVTTDLLRQAAVQSIQSNERISVEYLWRHWPCDQVSPMCPIITLTMIPCVSPSYVIVTLYSLYTASSSTPCSHSQSLSCESSPFYLWHWCLMASAANYLLMCWQDLMGPVCDQWPVLTMSELLVTSKQFNQLSLLPLYCPPCESWWMMHKFWSRQASSSLGRGRDKEGSTPLSDSAGDILSRPVSSENY